MNLDAEIKFRKRFYVIVEFTIKYLAFTGSALNKFYLRFSKILSAYIPNFLKIDTAHLILFYQLSESLCFVR